ncbi:MAG: hypothetical protein BGO77_02290 [Caedibacter sp. 37-49]|nr:MAG: hypothetical protein BGO77_02290 [Caedibacter sp. 37-49]
MTQMTRILKISLLIVTILTFSISGWCGNECLKLYDDEIEGRNFSRIFSVLTDFYTQNKESIQILNKEKFFIDDNYKNLSNNMKIALDAIKSNQSSAINQDYDSPHGFKVLKSHLRQISDCLKNSSSVNDLRVNEVQDLRNYTLGLRKIIEALRYEYPNLRT